MLETNNFTLYLIRHGESVINATPDVMGQNEETKLSPIGEKQANLLYKKLKHQKFDYVFASTYERAKSTAKIAMHKSTTPIILTEELREYSAGDWNGASRSATLTEDVKRRMNSFDHCFLPPNGESLHMVERRASKWLEDNIIYNKEMIEKSKVNSLNIAIFSHGMTIKCLLHYIMGFDKSLTWKVGIDNTSISKVSFGEYGWSVQSINDCSHLSFT